MLGRAGLPVLAACHVGGAAPLPPARPPEVPRREIVPPAPRLEPAPAPAPGGQPPRRGQPVPADPPSAQALPSPVDCLAELASAGIAAEPVSGPPASDPNCRIDEPVRLISVASPSNGSGPIRLSAGPTVACRYALPFGMWLGRVAAPVLAAAHGAPVRSVETGPGAECRSRDHLPGAKLSAHATGLAMDVSGFTFADGKSLAVKPSAPAARESEALEAARRAACGWFTTVLGPGSDAFHTDHIHLDIKLHGTSDRYKICQ